MSEALGRLAKVEAMAENLLHESSVLGGSNREDDGPAVTSSDAAGLENGSARSRTVSPNGRPARDDWQKVVGVWEDDELTSKIFEAGRRWREEEGEVEHPLPDSTELR